jgi:hypothetical protein
MAETYPATASAGTLRSPDGVRVTASGGFDPSWASSGIQYAVDVDGTLSDDAVSALLEAVDEVAEIPRTLRAGTTVKRVSDG